MPASPPKPIPDLWPTDVAVPQVLSPLVILRHQAGQLRAKTNNILEAEIDSSNGDGTDRHAFTLVVPALNRFRKVLFVVTHNHDQVYPASLEMDELASNGSFGAVYPSASTQDEFVELLRKALSTRQTVTVVQSLIAKANEVTAEQN